MNKQAKNRLILFMAYMYHFGWVAVMLLAAWLLPIRPQTVICVSLLLYAVWSLCGYLFRWKHFYCAYQNYYRRTMTPDEVDWSEIRKTDAYGIPIIFFVLGILALFC